MKEKGKNTKTEKKQDNGASYSESARAKWFCFALNLSLAQLIGKASLIFKIKFRVSFVNYFKRNRIIRF